MAITGAFNVTGGMAVVNRLVIRALLDQGYKIDVFALTENGGPECPLSSGCRRHHTFSRRKSVFVASLYVALAARRYSFVFVDLANLAAAIAPLSRLGVCRYVLWLHGREVFPPEPRLKGRIGVAHAWRLLASSDYTASTVGSRFPGHKVIPCDLALENGAYRLPDSGSQPLCLEDVDGATRVLGRCLILSVGRMDSVEQYKGHDSLLAAFPAVHERFPEAQLVLAGAGTDFARVRSIAVSLDPRVRGRIFMPGHVDRTLLQELYRACYLFALPSGREGFGVVYLEAMSCAKPCLAARAAGAPCVVRDGETGLLVDYPSSRGELSSALCSLLADPDRARAMGQAGFEAVRRRYLFEHFSERFWRAVTNAEPRFAGVEYSSVHPIPGAGA